VISVEQFSSPEINTVKYQTNSELTDIRLGHRTELFPRHTARTAS
jgi:hypothetical protein